MSVRSQEDIIKYKNKERYYFSSLIGTTWFKCLQELSEDKLEELKRDLDRKTMIGEFVGHKNHQHVISYSKETIVFYAIVSNES
jgi:hypothetical protein